MSGALTVQIEIGFNLQPPLLCALLPHHPRAVALAPPPPGAPRGGREWTRCFGGAQFGSDGPAWLYGMRPIPPTPPGSRIHRIAYGSGVIPGTVATNQYWRFPP